MNGRVSISIKKSELIFFVTILVSLYWFLGQAIDIYRFPVVGVVYELFWLIMLVALFVLPIVSFIYWFKNKLNFRSLYFYSFLISFASPLILITQFS